MLGSALTKGDSLKQDFGVPVCKNVNVLLEFFLINGMMELKNSPIQPGKILEFLMFK